MLGTRPVLHTVLGLFAVFLRDNIKRLTITGMRLPVVALINDVAGFYTACNTHTPTPLRV